MGENEKSFIQFVGRVLFPRDPGDLRNTMQCPACFTALTGSVCHSCQLDLNHPAALQLSAASTRAADALDERLEIIGRMRYETDQLIAERAARADAAAAAPASLPPHPAQQQPVAHPPLVRPPSAPPAGSIPAGPRRSTVQVMLVVVGVSLLSIFAIFGLVWAFITYGVGIRSLIIGTITAAALVTASLLHRRKLVATGEGIAAFAVVLVYLDAWAIRANDFFGLASSNESVYWGIALLVTSLAFLAWHRVSSMRVPSVAAHLSLVPAAGLLTAGLLDQAAIDSGSVTFFAGLVAAAVGMAHRVTVFGAAGAGAAERILLLAATAGALLIAAGAAWAAGPESDWAASIALVAVAAVALAHSYLLISLPGSTAAWHVAAAVFTAFGAVNAALAAPAVALRTGDSAVAAIAPAVTAIAIAIAFEAGWKRVKASPAAPSMLAGAVTAGAVAAFAALASAVAAVPPLLTSLGAVAQPWSLSSLDPLVTPTAIETEALVGVAVAVAALGLGWAVLGVLARHGDLLLYAAAVLVLLAVPQLVSSLPVALGYAVAAGIALGVLVRAKGLPRSYRPPLLALLAASTVISYSVGWVDRDAWWATVTTTVLLAIGARLLSRDSTIRATLFGTGVVVALSGVAAAGARIAQEGGEFPPYALMAITAGALIVFAAPRIPVLSSPDRVVTFWIAAVTGIVALTAGHDWSLAGRGLAGATGMSIATAAVLVGFLVWLALPATKAHSAARIVAALSLAPLAAWLCWNGAVAMGIATLGLTIAPVTALIAVTAGALTWQLVRGDSRRWAADTGSAVTAFVVVAGSVSAWVPELWLVLLLAAVGLLVASVSRDGLVGSASPRKHLGWVALAFATAALWLRLADSSVRDLEPYVLPLAGMLLIVGLLSWRGGERTHLGHPSRGAPHLLMAGLLVAIAPLAMVGGTGPIERPLIVGGVSALLLLVGTLTRENADVQPYLNSVAVAGAAGVSLVAAIRAFELFRSSPATVDARLEAWVVPAAVLLVIAAAGLARSGASQKRMRSGQSLAVVSLVALALLESAGADTTPLGSVRALALVLLLSAVHVLAFWWNRPPFGRPVAWTALGLAAVVGVGFALLEIADPFEYALVPVALALLASGGMQLASTRTARSWPWFGPGLLVLFVPSVLALYVDDPLWRVLGLGIVATICIIVGAVRRLQAPFVLGTIVLLAHLVTQLWPGIRFIYKQGEWWLWLGAAGVILIFLAATYERRIRNFRSVAMRIGALR